MAAKDADAELSSNTIERFLTIDEVAALLRLSTHQVRRLVNRGDIVVHRFGRVLRISGTDLETYMTRCRGNS